MRYRQTLEIHDRIKIVLRLILHFPKNVYVTV